MICPSLHTMSIREWQLQMTLQSFQTQKIDLSKRSQFRLFPTHTAVALHISRYLRLTTNVNTQARLSFIDCGRLLLKTSSRQKPETDREIEDPVHCQASRLEGAPRLLIGSGPRMGSFYEVGYRSRNESLMVYIDRLDRNSMYRPRPKAVIYFCLSCDVNSSRGLPLWYLRGR